MVQLFPLITVLASSVSISLAQSVTASAAYSPEQLSSASSRALQADASFFYEFLGDFLTRYNTYISFMEENTMTYPAAIQNYIVRLQSYTDEQGLFQALQTKSFPFSDFMTMYNKFDWASSFMSVHGVSTLYVPQDFLTGNVADASVTQSGSASGSGFSADSVVSSTSDSSAVSSPSSVPSDSANVLSSSSSSASASSSFTESRSSSENGVDSLYIPIVSFPIILASFFLL